MSEIAIRITGLQVRAAQRQLLEIAQLTVRHGERVAIVGPNGAGKSTLLRVLAGFMPARQGALCVLGREFGPDAGAALDARGWRSLRAEVGQVMQGLHLVARLTARENVILGALARPGAMSLWRSWLRLYPAALIDEAERALHDLGIAALAHTRADRLSGGERQKVGIARLRLQAPRLILADEPTSALDPRATVEVCQALRATAAHATLLTVVHNPELLPLLADRVIGLAEGRIMFDVDVRDATPDRLSEFYAQARPLRGIDQGSAWSVQADEGSALRADTAASRPRCTEIPSLP